MTILYSVHCTYRIFYIIIIFQKLVFYVVHMLMFFNIHFYTIKKMHLNTKKTIFRKWCQCSVVDPLNDLIGEREKDEKKTQTI